MSIEKLYIMRPARSGGVAEVCDALASEFSRKGLTVHVVTSHAVALKLALLCRNRRNVGVVTNVSFGVWGAAFRRSVFIVHGFPFRGNMPYWRYALFGTAHRIFCRLNKTCVAVSAFTRYTCEAHFGFRPNPVIWNMVPLGFSNRAPLLDRTDQVVFIGRLVEAKGAGVILEAIELLRKSRRVIMHVVGDGEQRDALTRRFRHEDTTFHGFVEASEKYAILYRSSVFVSMLEGEPFGLTSLEAYLTGNKLVLPLFGGHTEFVPSARLFLVRDARSVLDVRDQLERALNAPLLEAPSREVAQQFSPSTVAAAYLQLLEDAK